MVSKKIVTVLLILAIVLSVVSIAIMLGFPTLNIKVPEGTTASQTGRIVLEIVPNPENLENGG